MNPADDEKIGETLVRQGVISAEQLRKATEFRDSLGGGALRDLVVKLGYAKEQDVAKAIADQEQISSIEITADMVDVKTMAKVPRKTIDKHPAVILKSKSGTLLLAMADPNNYEAIEAYQFLTNRPVEPVVASKSAIRRALQQLDEEPELVEEEPSPASTAGSSSSVSELDELLTLSGETLIKAYVLCMIDKGQITIDEILESAAKVEKG